MYISKKPTLAECLDAYLRHSEGKSGYRVVKIIVNTLNKFFGRITVEKLTVRDIVKYCESRPIADNTLRRELSVLHAALAVAIKKGLIEKIDDVTGDYTPEFHRLKRLMSAIIDQKPGTTKRTIYPTETQVASILEHMEEPYKSIAWLCYHLAYRNSEVLKLQWYEVDLVGKEIRLDKTKNGKGRTTFLYPEVDAYLNRIYSERLARGDADNIQLEYVFGGRKKVSYSALYKYWNLACQKAGFGTTFHIHDLRRLGSRYLQEVKKFPADLVRDHYLGNSNSVMQSVYNSRSDDSARMFKQLATDEQKKTVEIPAEMFEMFKAFMMKSMNAAA
jgi:integrase